jgi:alkanesulfonate monooxygenase SsuD/methylene tetrahydromethanopterin reductase-like flavin-dependent oxidoreductase (luciferase family)
MKIGVKPGPWGWSWKELTESWSAAEDCGFDVLSCFDHVTASSRNLTAWDAPSLLIAMSGYTHRIRLAVDVINTALRHPFLLAAQLAVAQAASGGRLEVGLGAGSHDLARIDHDALGIAFPGLAQRTQMLERCCRLLPLLWRGGTVGDEALRIRAASLGSIGIEPPPIFVGGTSQEILRLTARTADGWNMSTPDPAAWTDGARRVDAMCKSVGRTRPLIKTGQLYLSDVGLEGIRGVLDRFRHAGADRVTVILVQERGPGSVRELARAVRT